MRIRGKRMETMELDMDEFGTDDLIVLEFLLRLLPFLGIFWDWAIYMRMKPITGDSYFFDLFPLTTSFAVPVLLISLFMVTWWLKLTVYLVGIFTLWGPIFYHVFCGDCVVTVAGAVVTATVIVTVLIQVNISLRYRERTVRST